MNRHNYILTLVVIALNVLITSQYFLFPKSANDAQFEVDKSQFKKAPEFTSDTGFINTSTLVKLADMKGKVILVRFRTYTCINCIHTISHLNDWYEKFSNKGLVISVFRHLFHIKYPVILDNNYVNWNAYGNSYWPRDYLVDNQGLIRYNHIGEGDYAQTEEMIKSLLAEGTY
jgi:thiol-disulfide isomerase/thioredoxin